MADPMGNGYVYDDRYFNSFQEVQCYGYLKHIGIPPGKMHMEYRLGRNHIDFFPLKRVFWEHHPINIKLGKNIYKYGKERRAILDRHGYSHIPLVVSDTMFTDVSDICLMMKDHGVDFRKGKVPNETGIYFLHDFEKDFMRHEHLIRVENMMLV